MGLKLDCDARTRILPFASEASIGRIP